MRKTISILLFCSLGFSTLTFAQHQKLQSVFIFSFTRYILWPDDYNQGDFEILVLGDAPILEELKTMAKTKKVSNGDRAIKVTKIDNVSDIRKCNILFVPASKSGKLSEVLGKVNTQSILVLTEESGLGAKGSDINFIVKDGKLAFELNQTALGKQNLKASNELSRVAIMI